MSVTKEGIQGYEYQYKITVLLSLLAPFNSSKLFVEIKGKEDATLLLNENGNNKTIEIQVKKEKSILNISKLTEWLCHFEERKSDKNLLQRLIEDKNTIALFVSRSRCSDETLFLKKDLNAYNSHQNIKINRKNLDIFNKALSNISLNNWNKLKTDRIKFCKKQTFNTIKDLKNLYTNIVIWEEITDDKVNNEIKNILNLKYQIPQSKTNDVYLNLLEIVKKGRDGNVDILPLVYELLQKNKSRQPKIDKHYIERIEEKKLIEKLEKKNVLLLTGISLCGKSEVAKKIANHFFLDGYNYNIYNSIDDTIRFFETNTNEKKIVILEDPWGHIKLEEDYLEITSKIKKIIKNLELDFKLIITSRIEIILDVFDTQNIDDCKLTNIRWVDLTITDNNTLNNFFIEITSKKHLPDSFIDLLSNNILKAHNNNLLQIGQLLYLINKEESEIINKTYQELEHIARFNSKEVANEIKNKNSFYAEVLSVLSLCATTIEPTTINDIGFVFSNDNKLYSTIEKGVFTASFNTKENDYPKYENDYSKMNNHLSDSLEYLEERQLIIIDGDKITFRHPNYYEAGRYLFKSKSSIKQKRFFSYYKRAVTCINPKTTFLASKQLPFTYRLLQKNKTDIIDIAFLGLNSIYPATEDNSLIFLVNILDDLDEEKSKEVIRETQSGGSDTSQIFWYKGIPYISNRGGMFQWLSISISNNELKNIAFNLENNNLVSTYEAYAYLEKLRYENNLKLNYSILKTLLKYNEGFIRKKAAFITINHYKNLKNSITKEIFDDKHPSVVFNAIRATFLNWTNYSKTKQKVLFSLIQKSLQNKSIAIRTFNLITTFSIDYGHEGLYNFREINEKEKKELWNLWGRLFPIVFRIVPKDAYINTARFSASMTDAFKYIDTNIGINVLESWYNRTDYLIKKGKYLDEFEMTIALELMELTKTNYKIRKDLFNKLITYEDTNFILSSLKWIIQYWEDLHITEKNKIINLIKSNRTDIRWIKAVLLTSNTPPKEIIFEILNEKDLFEQNEEYVVSKFQAQLLKDCLNVYCGFPQPLWWLAVHHNNNKFWNKIIRHIMLNEEIPGFEICVEEFTTWGVNGFTEKWKDGIEFWEKVCHKTKNKNILAENLIYETASSTCNLTTTKKLWEILINSYSIINKEKEIISIIVDNFEVLQQTGHKEDIFEIFDNKFLFNKIIPELNPDSLLIKMLEFIGTNEFYEDEEKIKTIRPIIKISKQKNIRFFGTFNYFKNLKERKIIPIEIIIELESFSNIIDEIGKNKLKKMKEKRQYELQNWITKSA